MKASKRINRRGQRTIDYEKWRDTVGKPYLDKHFGRVCADCGRGEDENNTLDVDHIDGRGSHAESKTDVNNIQYLCNYPCHFNKTNHLGKYKEQS